VRKYRKEIVILLAQLFMFYLFPLFAGPTDAMGMVFLIIAATLLLSLMIGGFSGRRIKYLYPLVISALFLPTVPIHYNSSALVHGLWYLVISACGLAIGATLRWLCRMIRK